MLITRTRPDHDVDVPELRELSDEVRDLEKLSEDLAARYSSLNTELFDTIGRVRAVGKVDLARGLRERDIAAAMGMPSPPVPTDLQTLQQRCAELRTEVEVVSEARQRADEQLATARARASTELCRRVEGAHRDLATALANQVLQLHRAHLEYATFLDVLRTRHVSFASLLPIQPEYAGSTEFLGEAADRRSNVARYLRECVQKGHLRSNEIPVELR